MPPTDTTPESVYSDRSRNPAKSLLVGHGVAPSRRPAITAFPSYATDKVLFAQVEEPAQGTRPAINVKANPNRTSVVLVDSPNATRTVDSVYGPNAKPDWGAILQIGTHLGSKARGIVAVNDGLPERMVQKFRALGYVVQFSHARDVDDRVVAQAVRMVDRAQVFAIVSGDGGFCSLVTILRRLRKHVIVIAVEDRCHPRLRALAHEFYPLPVLSGSAASATTTHPAYAQPANGFGFAEFDHAQSHGGGNDRRQP